MKILNFGQHALWTAGKNLALSDTKMQTKKKIILSNKKRIINSIFSRTRNAVSEFDSTAIEKHQRF